MAYKKKNEFHHKNYDQKSICDVITEQKKSKKEMKN